MGISELVFQEADGGYCAECLTENIFTEEGYLGAVASETCWNLRLRFLRPVSGPNGFAPALSATTSCPSHDPRGVPGTHLADILLATRAPAADGLGAAGSAGKLAAG